MIDSDVVLGAIFIAIEVVSYIPILFLYYFLSRYHFKGDSLLARKGFVKAMNMYIINNVI